MYVYNVTLKRVRITIVAVQNQTYYIFRVCVYSLSYLARRAHASYYIVICGVPGCIMIIHIIS